jgi:hypothetical protein
MTIPPILLQIQSVLQNICGIILAILGVALFLGTITKVWKATFRKHVVIGFLLVVCTYYGGTKSIYNKTSADEGINLLQITLDEIKKVVEENGIVSTNVVGAQFTIYTTPDSAIPYPIWFRDSNYQKWTNVVDVATWTPTAMPVLNHELSGSGTNVYEWTSVDFTNNMKHAQWYIGTDLPWVQVDVTDKDYIFIEEVSITSKRVHIRFSLNPELDYPEGTIIEVQRKIGNGKYEVVDTLEAIPEGIYQWNGFAVGVNSKWRLHIAITQEEN